MPRSVIEREIPAVGTPEHERSGPQRGGEVSKVTFGFRQRKATTPRPERTMRYHSKAGERL